MQAVAAVVKQCLTADSSSFELYTTPPRTVLPLDQSLKQQHLFPQAKVFASESTCVPLSFVVVLTILC